tara:strand:+ start:262 stop:516 length:255 start_codon:yes stop_codon:yes gene_type:complete
MKKNTNLTRRRRNNKRKKRTLKGGAGDLDFMNARLFEEIEPKDPKSPHLLNIDIDINEIKEYLENYDSQKVDNGLEEFIRSILE